MRTGERIAFFLISAVVGIGFNPALASAAGDAPNYDSANSTERPAQWGFGTPEEDARPGQYFFYKAVEAIRHRDYQFAIGMYETSASWAYKPAEYNLAVMYFNGEGVAVDKPRAMAWIALAAERTDAEYVAARELIYAHLTTAEFAHANQIWRELKKTYGDAVALDRAKARWAQVKAAITGSRVGAIGNLKVGGGGSNVKPVALGPGGRSILDGNTFSAFGVLSGGSMDGAVAYKQLRESDNPYDPKFRQRTGTATVGPLVPVPDDTGDTHDPDKDRPTNG